MWFALSVLLAPPASASELETTCRWTDLSWRHYGAQLRLPGTDVVFARLGVGMPVNGRLGLVDGDLRLRLDTRHGVRITGDVQHEHEIFELSHGPLPLNQGAVLTTHAALVPTGIDGDGVKVRPVLPGSLEWVTPLEGRAACRQLNLLPSGALSDEQALAEAGIPPGERRILPPGELRDADGKVIVRNTASYPDVVWLQETRGEQARVVSVDNGVVWSSWVDAATLSVPKPRGTGSGGGGSAEGVLPLEVPMKTVQEARCPDHRALWYAGKELRVEVGSVTPEQVLRLDGDTSTGTRVLLLEADVEPVDGHFEVANVDGCSLEEREVPR